MGAGQNTVGFGAGLAKGLAQAFGTHRAEENQSARERESRQMQIGGIALQHLLQSGRVADYNDILPIADMAFGTGGKKPGKGAIDPHQIMQMVLGPALAGGGGGAAPGGADVVESMAAGPAAATPAAAPQATSTPQSIVQGMGQPRPQSTPQGPPVAQSPGAGTAAAPPAGARQPGIRLLSDAEMIERQTSNEGIAERATMDRRSKLARELYGQFKDIDPDFTLYDALAMAGFKTDYNRQYSSGTQGVLRGLDAFWKTMADEKGAPLTSAEMEDGRERYFATNRASTDREALSRSSFGVSFNQLNQAQQQEVNRKVEALTGSRAYTRTASSAEATFNAPLTPQAAQQTNLPVGTRGPEVAGQTVSTAVEMDNRRSTEGLRDTLIDIRDRLIDPALPDASELSGLAPGAASAVRSRTTHREQYAALEAAVNNVVNVVARTVAQQRGAQTEQDAKRAEAAIVSLKNSLLDPLAGDTRQTAKVRINESLKIIEEVLGKLPQQAVPVTPAPRGGGGTPRPSAAVPATGGATRQQVRAFLAANNRRAEDADITTFMELNPTWRPQ